MYKKLFVYIVLALLALPLYASADITTTCGYDYFAQKIVCKTTPDPLQQQEQKRKDAQAKLDSLKAQYGLSAYNTCLPANAYTNPLGADPYVMESVYIQTKYCLESKAQQDRIGNDIYQKLQCSNPATYPNGAVWFNGRCVDYNTGCRENFGPNSYYKGIDSNGKLLCADRATTPPPAPVQPIIPQPPAVLGVNTGDVHPAGTILFADDWKTVYVMGNGVRRGFATPEEFQSHGFKFSEIIKGNSADYQLSEGAVMPFADGTLVLDSTDNRTVYIIDAGSKRGFTAPEVFTGLGYQFSQAVKGNVSKYPTGVPIGSSTSSHPEGALINVNNTVYKVSSGGKQVFPDQKVFDSWSYSFNRVVLANSADTALPTLTPIKFRDGTILKRNNNSDNAYLVSEGKLRPFSSGVALLNFGYDFGDSVSVTDADIAGYETGGVVK